MLTGALDKAAITVGGDFRSTAPRFVGENLDSNLALVAKIEELAASKQCTPGQLALAWVLAQGDDVVPIPGTKRVRYLEENVASLDVVLDDEDHAAIESAVPRGAVAGNRYVDMSSIDK
jgi:aryl-alcohol dehydrogenase-like predicted oxidoreductase